MNKTTYFLSLMTFAISTSITAKADELSTPLNFKPDLAAFSHCSVKHNWGFGTPVSEHCELMVRTNLPDGGMNTNVIHVEQDFTDTANFAEHERKYDEARENLQKISESAKEQNRWVVLIPGHYNLDNLSQALHVGKRQDDPNAVVEVIASSNLDIIRALTNPKYNDILGTENLIKDQVDVSLSDLGLSPDPKAPKSHKSNDIK